MERTRAIEIIEAYGGHPAAWPDAERAAAEALVAEDIRLRTMMTEARELDRVLRDWACELVAATEVDAMAAADAALAARAEPPGRRWLPRAAFGGLLAASLAVGALLVARPDAVPPPAIARPQGVQVALAALPGENAEAAQDMLVWGSVFTPTPAEETVL